MFVVESLVVIGSVVVVLYTICYTCCKPEHTEEGYVLLMD